MVGFPTLGVQTWESYVHAAMFPGVCVNTWESVHVAMFPGLCDNSWESFTLVSVLAFPGLLVDSLKCVVPTRLHV